MARLTTATKWRRLLRWLRNTYPANYPVRVERRRRSTKEKELCGYCVFRTNQFFVFVDRRQDWALQVDTLIHEWAHALTWHGNDDDDHGPEWGLAYAMLYRAFLVWNYGEPLTE